MFRKGDQQNYQNRDQRGQGQAQFITGDEVILTRHAASFFKQDEQQDCEHQDFQQAPPPFSTPSFKLGATASGYQERASGMANYQMGQTMESMPPESLAWDGWEEPLRLDVQDQYCMWDEELLLDTDQQGRFWEKPQEQNEHESSLWEKSPDSNDEVPQSSVWEKPLDQSEESPQNSFWEKKSEANILEKIIPRSCL